MAASFSRLDPTSPASIASASFSTGRKGFNQDEVRAFLQAVSAEVARLQERQRQFDGELAAARQAAAVPAEIDDEAITKYVGEETVRVLQTARESASQIKIRAEENAARLVTEATDGANRLRQDAEVEIARKRQDANTDAESERTLAKQQGREMVQEARSYRERVLADLERRTKLARGQIEELATGRDRLLQVFERARLVAVDVTTDLQELDGPAELVNLTPTTGPVPLMVPNDRAAPGSTGDDAPTEAIERPSAASDAEEDRVVAPVPDTDTQTDTDTDSGTTSDPSDVDGSDGVAEDAGDEDMPDLSAPITSIGDGNVVELFRGRNDDDDDDDDDDDHGSELVDDDETVDHDETVDDEIADQAAVDDDVADMVDQHPDADSIAKSADVGGIFERLRTAQVAERSEPEAPEVHPDEVGDSDSGAEGSTDTGSTDTGTTTTTTDTTTGTDEATSAPRDAFQRRDEALAPLIVTAARKLKRVLADEQNGVLDSLRSELPIGSLDELLPSATDQAERYTESIEEDLIEAAAAGATEVGVKNTKALHSTLSRSGATSRSVEIIDENLVGMLRTRLERCVVEGSEDNGEITKRVRSVYREWKTQHIDDLLDDVLRFSYGGGLAALTEPGTPVEWRVDQREAACADCEDNSLAGAVTIGAAFPTGHTSAPAHPGCRCLTLPADQ